MEVVLSASKHSVTEKKGEGSILLWELKSGALLQNFKNNSVEPNGFCFIGEDYFAATQSENASGHIWNWKKVS
jgi:hypothetical protein